MTTRTASRTMSMTAGANPIARTAIVSAPDLVEHVQARFAKLDERARTRHATEMRTRFS